ncbi:hypothetical protein BJF88_06305 [Cellulosimicrobium sp. CUA-896]|nr:hypothetical protein BJF88_06305 [Cellulosimicrobium sp. CUA-896]
MARSDSSHPATVATAAATAFDPGNIISDAVFYDATSMTAAQVASFIQAEGAGCRATSGNTCLKDYRESTPTRAASSLCPGPYAGGSNETAAAIISKVALACGINPQVLLVTLQKEQGLVTASDGRPPRTYSRALGFGCPDNTGGVCNPEYAGFANQVYSAARQLQRYAAYPTSYAHRAGAINQVRFHPDASCGTSSVHIENQATASLYNYTPYQPNAAALAAGYGTGDACSSYGNRNFHLYFTRWFGSPVQREPIGHVDTIEPAGAGTVSVRGWAIDHDAPGPINVHVYVDGRGARSLLASTPRSDIERIYGRTQSGFSATVPVSAGQHEVCVYAINQPAGANPRLACKTVTVTNRLPLGHVDSVTVSGPDSVAVRGWAIDRDAPGPINVHVYVDGRAAVSILASTPRSDIERIYGRAQSGFSATVPVSAGDHEVCLYAINQPSGSNPRLACKAVTVTNQRPIGHVDSITPAPGQLTVRGWALDRDTTASIPVHVYVDGKLAGSASAATSRSDIERIYGLGAAHGYTVTVPASDGSHRVCVYAINTPAGSNPSIGCGDVTVRNAAPRGALDVVDPATPAETRVRGWAFDPDDGSPLTVRYLVDGTTVATERATTSRPDVARAFGVSELHGFDRTLALTHGVRKVCVEALDATTAAPITLGCKSVSVPDTPTVGELTETSGEAATTAVTPPTVTVTGWAWDYDSPSPVVIQLAVDGEVVESGTAGRTVDPRPSAAGRSTVGFALSARVDPGTHEVCARAKDPSSGTTVQLGCSPVTIANINPFGALDVAQAGPAGLRVRGWAMDPDRPEPINVHVYVDGALQRGVTANLSRPDVERVHDNGALHGFDLTLPVPAGAQEVCVYAINWPAGANPRIGCGSVAAP